MSDFILTSEEIMELRRLALCPRTDFDTIPQRVLVNTGLAEQSQQCPGLRLL